MRASVLSSSVVHLVILAALLVVRIVPPLIVPGPDVVQVALVEPSAVVTQPPPPVEKPQPQAPEIKPTEESGVKLAPPKPPKKKTPEKREERAPAEPAPALPYAP